MQEIRIDYFIRLGACQAKFLGVLRAGTVLLQFFHRKWIINHFFSKFHTFFYLHHR